MLGSMLDSTKSGFLKYIILFFILAAGGGLVLMDVGGFFTGGSISPNYVATVGKIKISAQDFDQKFSEVAYREDLSTREAYQRGLATNYLQGLVAQNLIYQAAYDNGLRVSPESMIDEIRQYLDPYINEDTTAKEAFENFLRSQGMSEEEFTGILEKDAVIKLLTQSVTDIAVIPGALALDFAQASEHKRNISALVFPVANADISDQITDQALQEHYEKIKELYAIPETRSFNVLKFTLDDVSKALEITKEQKQNYYADNIDLFTVPEQRTIEQALVKDQLQAQKIYDAVMKGTALKTAVTSTTGDSKAYRAPEDYQKIGLLEDIGNAVFDVNVETGKVLEPIKSPLGWHVVKVTNITAPKIKNFAAVEKDVYKYLRDELLDDQFYEMSLNIEESLDSGMNVGEIAKQFDLKLHTVTNASLKDIDKLSFAEEPTNAINQAFETPLSESTILFEDGDGYLALTVTDVKEKSYQPFDSIKKDVEENFITTRKTEITQQQAAKIKAAIDAGNLSFAEAAKKPNVTLRTASKLSRQGRRPNFLSQLGLISLFRSDIGETLLLPDTNNIVIARVDSLSIPPEDNYGDDKIQQTGKALSSILQNINFETYLQGLQRRYDVKINEEALRVMYAGDGLDY